MKSKIRIKNKDGMYLATSDIEYNYFLLYYKGDSMKKAML